MSRAVIPSFAPSYRGHGQVRQRGHARGAGGQGQGLFDGGLRGRWRGLKGGEEEWRGGQAVLEEEEGRSGLVGGQWGRSGKGKSGG